MDNSNKRKLPSSSISKISIKKGKKLPERTFTCKYRGCNFATKNYNEFNDHPYKKHLCEECKCVCVNKITHRCKTHKCRPIPIIDINDTKFIEKARSNKGAIVSLLHEYKDNVLKIRDAFKLVKKDIFLLLNKYMVGYKGIRAKFILKLIVTELKTGERKIRYYHSAYTRLTNQAFIQRVCEDNIVYIENTIEMLTELGSGIKVEGIPAMEIDIVAYQPLKPKGYTKLPVGLKRRNGLLNIKCDKDCFRLSILAALYGAMITLRKHPEVPISELTPKQKENLKMRMTAPKNYKNIIAMVKKDNLLDFSGFENTFDLNNLSSWEEKNSVGVTVYKYDEESASVIQHRYPERKFNTTVSLLLIGEGDTSHLVLIQDPASFFTNERGRRLDVCPYCSKGYRKPSHLDECGTVNECRIQPVKSGEKFFKFRQFYKCLPPPFCIFTSLLYYQDESREENTTSMNVAGYGVAVIDSKGDIYTQKFLIGRNAMDDYLTYVFDLAKELSKKLSRINFPSRK